MLTSYSDRECTAPPRLANSPAALGRATSVDSFRRLPWCVNVWFEDNCLALILYPAYNPAKHIEHNK